ncbi:MAG TPA: hypothetical protein VK206_21790 [Anaerolineales bacterium]|nr:hypothetical protein [Anaerolineales bacterium]
MKKVILTLLGIIVVLGLFAAAGFAGYRLGFAQGVRLTANGNATRPQQPQQVRPFDNFGPRGMPMRPFGNDFGRGIRRGFGGFPMMGFGFFGPVMFLGRILVFALIIWFVYWLFTRSGWQLVRTTQTTTTTPTPPPAPSTDNADQNTDVNP